MASSICQILDHIPISGTEIEIGFSPQSSNLWVEFEKSNFEKWYGFFGRGEYGVDKLICILKNFEAFVLSGGKCYWIDIEKQATFFPSENENFENNTEAIYSDTRNVITTAALGSIRIYDHQGLQWESERIAPERIEFSEEREGLIYARAELGSEWKDFHFNIDQRKIVGINFPF